jgi:hypothetical protein
MPRYSNLQPDQKFWVSLQAGTGIRKQALVDPETFLEWLGGVEGSTASFVAAASTDEGAEAIGDAEIADSGAAARSVSVHDGLTRRELPLHEWTGVDPTGSTTCGTQIQAAIDRASQLGIQVVARKTDIFKIGATGSKVIRSGTENYGLQFPSGIRFDGRGCTFKLAPSTNASVITNKESALAGPLTDADIHLHNFTVDGDGAASLTAGALIHLYAITGLRMSGVKVKNGRRFAGVMNRITRAHIDDLSCESIVGNGFNIGTQGTVDDLITNSYIGRIEGTGCSNLDSASAVGNPCVIAGRYCQIGTLWADNCEGGHKISVLSAGLQIALVIFLNGTSTNSGLKIQGESGFTVPDIQVGRVYCNGLQGSGLFLQYCPGLQIGQYNGVGNALAGNAPDVSLTNADYVVFGSISSRNAGQIGVNFGANLTEVTAGRILVIDPATVTTAVAAIQVASGLLRVPGKITCVDTRGGSARMSKGLDVTVATAGVKVDDAEVSGHTSVPIDIDVTGPIAFGSYVRGKWGTDAISGSVTLTAAATTTNITCNSARGFTGMRSKIRVTAINASARALERASGPCLAWQSALSTIQLVHGAAAGGEIFQWEFEGYVASVAFA